MRSGNMCSLDAYCLVIEVDQSLTGEDVVRALTKIACERNQYPQRIQADNGPEFVSFALDRWAYAA